MLSRKHFRYLLAGLVLVITFYFKPAVSDPPASVQTPLQPYSQITLIKREYLKAQSGVKSVLFNSSGSRLYALNLEGMSIYEFDRRSREFRREFRFAPTPALGWDYILRKPVPSFAEKPVEAVFTHSDKLLWTSLHNAEGVVPIPLESVRSIPKTAAHKTLQVVDKQTGLADTLLIPLVRTGKTPKVLARTADDRFLMVSNWHSQTITVLRTNDTVAPFGRPVATIAVKGIPRGIAIDHKSNRSYVALMDGGLIAVIDNKTWKLVKYLEVEQNPRHILADGQGRLFISFNAGDKVGCYSANTGKLLFSAPTRPRPRTIIFSSPARRTARQDTAVFDRPDTSAAVKFRLKGGNSMQVLGAFGDFELIRSNGQTGWVSR